MTVPADTSRLLVAGELELAKAWFPRHQAVAEWRSEELELRVTLKKAGSELLYYLKGQFDEYRMLPPRLRFCGKAWDGETDPRNYPKVQRPSRSPLCIMGGAGPVICAPFNRLAYVEFQGPHSDWGGPAAWQSVNTGVIRAVHIGDMLQALQVEVNDADGAMGGA